MKHIKCYLFVLAGLLVLQLSCKEDAKKVIRTEPITFKKEGELTLYRAETDSIITKLDIEIADTDYETQTGLMYRNAMAENQGMLFIFPDATIHSFYMKNTEIALDILFIDEDLRIISFHKNARPFDETGLSSQIPVQYVLEINAGMMEKWSLEVGDRLEFIRL